MGYLVGFVCVLALVASPLGANAQTGEEVIAPEPPSQDALQLEIGADGVDLVPSPPRTVDGYTRKEMEHRVHRAKVGVGVSALPLLVGAIIATASSLSSLNSGGTGSPTHRVKTLL